ncbi:insulinase family protein [Luteolibacter flavescens]|uniref:Insulinase family protein n=1 Tax=Luteolibacter flavescens TaxID=1859460 RepID=A0ABT3FJ30_9BACT|nr:pitrilysin family protein [Luteolibacter flavescens]MCW1883462.1 insulinase family protein [Luteolibacter flavescens]
MSRARYEMVEMPGGFRLAVATLPDSECAALSLHVPAGSRDDPAGKAGLAHFVEHMVFKGTARRDARAISLETEDVGASLNAFTTEDEVTYEARGEAETLPLLADILSDMVWNAAFPEAEIKLEREVIGEEIVMYRESPSDHIGDLISAALWSPHPLGESIAGTEKSIAKINRKALAEFRDRHHFRRDVVIAVAGPFSVEEARRHLLPHLPESRALPEGIVLDPSLLPAPRHLRETRDTEQLQLALGFRTLGRRDPRRHALRLLGMILGESASSRLFQELREKRGLCYQISCDVNLFDEAGSLEVHAGLAPDSREESLECIFREIEDLRTNGPRADELARAKRLAVSQTKMAMESTAAHASWIGDCLLQYDRLVTPEEVRAEWDKVTAAEVRDIAAEMLDVSRHALAEILPE